MSGMRAVVAAGLRGTAGRGVASAAINPSAHLIVTYTDGAQEDAGVIDIAELIAPLVAQVQALTQSVAALTVRVEDLESGAGPIFQIAKLVDTDGQTLVDDAGEKLIAGDI